MLRLVRTRPWFVTFQPHETGVQAQTPGGPAMATDVVCIEGFVS